jgi:hypothetical protein
MVVLRAIRLPELDKNRVIKQQKALVFNGDIRYDLILGADFLTKSSIDIRYSSGTIEWFDSKLPMRDPRQLDNKDYLAMAEALEVHCKEEHLFGRDWYNPDCYATKILDAKYNKVSIMEVMKQCSHLNATQQEDLCQVLKDFPKLFDGTLGIYPHRKFHINCHAGCKAKACQALCNSKDPP